MSAIATIQLSVFNKLPTSDSLTARRESDPSSANVVSDDPPAVADWFQNGFHRFLGTYLRRHFHAIGVDRSTRPDLSKSIKPDSSVLVFGNHPSWWDPLIGHFLNLHLLSPHQFHAPIDHTALQQYKVFAKLGFFGVQKNRAGVAEFLRQSNNILDADDRALWITPEGRFADARDHGESLMPGLSHLCSRRDDGIAIAMAMEYVFWDERLPVCLIRFSEPISIQENSSLEKSQWSDLLTDTLRTTQNELAELSIARSSEPFDDLLRGKKGAGGVYDLFRRVKSFATGKKFRAKHGNQFE